MGGCACPTISSHKSECEVVALSSKTDIPKRGPFGTFVNLWSGFSPPADSPFSVHGTGLSAVDKRSLPVTQLSGFSFFKAFSSMARFVPSSRLHYGLEWRSISTILVDASSQWNKRRSRKIHGMRTCAISMPYQAMMIKMTISRLFPCIIRTNLCKAGLRVKL